ncbi:MAG: protease inhibitor I42 family protein [Methanomicrobium sp.]|nr:protease inhibitor I42 family protein [Methanomicrobium sp.]
MRKLSIAGIAAASLLLAFIAFAGCTGTCYNMFYKDDNGTSQEVKQGCIIYIELSENPTTGYAWEMDTGGLTLVNDEYIPDEHAEGMTGVGGIHKWELSADKKGTYNVKGIYKRSWEETTPEDETWTVTVNVV